jgi:hypothetical protein
MRWIKSSAENAIEAPGQVSDGPACMRTRGDGSRPRAASRHAATGPWAGADRQRPRQGSGCSDLDRSGIIAGGCSHAKPATIIQSYAAFAISGRLEPIPSSDPGLF